MRHAVPLALLGLSLAATSLHASSHFDFENVPAGTPLPFTLSVNGLSATFGGAGGGICAASGLSGNLFVSLTGNALMQGFCTPTGTGPVTVNFGQPVLKVRFSIAVNGITPVPVTINYLSQGAVVGTQTITPAVPANGISPEAVVTFAGNFDSISLSSAGLIALDNLDVAPAP